MIPYSLPQEGFVRDLGEPQAIERNILKAYRRFGSNCYELVLLFKPYYLDRTPSPAIMDRIKKRYPLNPTQKKIIRRYEKVAPGELAHIDLTKVPKDIRTVFKLKDLYVAAFLDDCTRLTYSEILKVKKSFYSHLLYDQSPILVQTDLQL